MRISVFLGFDAGLRIWRLHSGDKNKSSQSGATAGQQRMRRINNSVEERSEETEDSCAPLTKIRQQQETHLNTCTD